MEFKGTKGKWEVYKPDHIGCVNVSVGKYDGFNGFVELWHHHFENKQEAEANAKLIASAPEMFEMLKEANQTIQRLRLLISAHPDCVDGSEFVDYVNFSYKKEKEIEKLLKKITE